LVFALCRLQVDESIGKITVKDAKGKYLYEDAWKYLFTHPVNETGNPVPPEDDCRIQHRLTEP
jgi:hypothetical protein